MSYERKPLEHAQTSTLAILSLIAGILSVIFLILLCVPCLRIFTIIFGLAASIMGFISLRQINTAEGSLTGRGMAIAGLVTGLVSLLLVIVLLIIGVSLSLPAFLIPILSGEYY
ncbi:MAG: DUF4190 domain-containing protein [Brevefilum sp.]